jgi:hypothetical protein
MSDLHTHHTGNWNSKLERYISQFLRHLGNIVLSFVNFHYMEIKKV